MTSFIKVTVYADKRGKNVLVINGRKVRTHEEIKKVLSIIPPKVLSLAINTFNGIKDAEGC